jgi:hypothetical protein
MKCKSYVVQFSRPWSSSDDGRLLAYSERGVRRAPDLLPEDYAGSEEDSGSLCD